MPTGRSPAKGSTSKGGQPSGVEVVASKTKAAIVVVPPPAPSPLPAAVELLERKVVVPAILNVEPYVYVNKARLKLRYMDALESGEIGWLPPGSRVRVLERRILLDGTRRAILGALEDGKPPLGWVSTVARDGSDSIRPEAQEQTADGYDSDDDFDLPVGEKPTAVVPQPTPTPMPSTEPPSPSYPTSVYSGPLATAAFGGAQVGAAGVVAVLASAPAGAASPGKRPIAAASSGGGGKASAAIPSGVPKRRGGAPSHRSGDAPSNRSGEGGSSNRALTDTPLKPKGSRSKEVAGKGGAGSHRGESAADGAGGGVAAGASGSPVNGAKGQAAAEMRAAETQAAEELEVAIAAEEAKLDEKLKTLKVRLGEALVKKQAKVKELVGLWAPKGGKAAITRMDFRKHVRTLVDEPNVKLIDELFGELDEDGGGSLDVAELTAAMRKLQDEAKQNVHANEKVRDTIAFLHSRLEMVRDVLSKMAEAEALEEKLVQLTQNVKCVTRVGAALAKKNMKIEQIVVNWETNKGEMSAKLFRKNIRSSLQVEADDDELNELFEGFDAEPITQCPDAACVHVQCVTYTAARYAPQIR